MFFFFNFFSLLLFEFVACFDDFPPVFVGLDKVIFHSDLSGSSLSWVFIFFFKYSDFFWVGVCGLMFCMVEVWKKEREKN